MFSCNHLWSGVTRTSAGCFDELSWAVGFAQAEVDELDVVVGIDQDVLRLYVSVRDPIESQVFDGKN